MYITYDMQQIHMLYIFLEFTKVWGHKKFEWKYIKKA